MGDRALQAQQQTIRIPAWDIDDQQSLTSYGAAAQGSGQMLINCIAKTHKSPITGETEVIVEKRNPIQTTAVKVDTIVAATTQLAIKDNICMTQLRDVNVGVWFDGTVSKHYIIMYRPIAGTVTKIAEIASADRRDFVHLTELGIGSTNVPYLGVVWIKYDRTSSAAYYSSGATGVLTSASWAEITDADFPPKKGTPEHLTGPMVQMNGTIYVMTQLGRIYNSDYLSVSSWNSLGVIQAIAYPDRGVGLCRYKHHIVAFGEDSIEFFNDVGNPSPASPLERTEQAFIKFGCASPRLFINIDDTLYWVARSSSGSNGLWKLDGYTPVKLSGPKQSEQIAQAMGTDYFNTTMHCLNMCGTQNVFINGPIGYQYNGYGATWWDNANDPYLNGSGSDSPNTLNYRSLAYNIDNGTWWGFRDCSGVVNGMNIYIWPCGYYGSDSTPVGFFRQYVLKGYDASSADQIGFTTGKNFVYYIDPADSYTQYEDTVDATVNYSAFHGPVQASIQWNLISFQNLERKFIHRLKVLLDEVWNFTAAEPNPQTSFLYVYYAKAGGFNSGTGVSRWIQLPNSSYRYYINNLGAARNLAVTVINQSNTKFICRGLELTVSQGTH